MQIIFVNASQLEILSITLKTFYECKFGFGDTKIEKLQSALSLM